MLFRKVAYKILILCNFLWIFSLQNFKTQDSNLSEHQRAFHRQESEEFIFNNASEFLKNKERTETSHASGTWLGIIKRSLRIESDLKWRKSRNTMSKVAEIKIPAIKSRKNNNFFNFERRGFTLAANFSEVVHRSACHCFLGFTNRWELFSCAH